MVYTRARLASKEAASTNFEHMAAKLRDSELRIPRS